MGQNKNSQEAESRTFSSSSSAIENILSHPVSCPVDTETPTRWRSYPLMHNDQSVAMT